MNTRGNHIVYGVSLAKGNARFEKGAEVPYFECAEYRPSGTTSHELTGGASNQAYVWETRQLTHAPENDSPDFATLDAGNNRVSLPAGVYDIVASAPAFSVDEHQTRLWDATEAALIIEGTPEFAASDTTGTSQTRSYIKGRFTLSQTTNIEIQHSFATIQADNGFGIDGGFYIDNVYTQMQIWQIREDA